jgi:C_GCAxxG_C_C family probable redox protein
MKTKNDTRKVFFKKGSCSQTFFYLLNREFDHLKEPEERASDPLAGGLCATGHQCGMLWGSALAIGAETFRRYGNSAQAISMAVQATQHVMESFAKRTNTVNCRNITGCDLTTRAGMRKLMLKTILGAFIYSHCFNLAKKWAPEAIQSATEGLSHEQTNVPYQSVSCASVTAAKMGANNEQIAMVSGFAGGLGLSGNACGALAAAVWMNTIDWCRKNPGKFAYSNPVANKVLNAFYNATDSKILCRDICGKNFMSLSEHTEFITNGGCNTLINTLAKLQHE